MGKNKHLMGRAAAEMERRKRAGEWGGGVEPMEEYQGRYLEFGVEVLGIPEETLRWSMAEEYRGHAWDGSVDPIAAMLDGVGAKRNVGLESGTGTGKTFALAVLVLGFLAAWKDSLVITVAPKRDQLLDQVWMEIGRLWPKFQEHFPNAKLYKSGEIRMRPDEPDDRAWKAEAFVAGVGATEASTTKAQGFHRENMLIVTEETPGMPGPTMVALSETRSDDHNLQVSVGNPDSVFDELHKFCLKDSVLHIRASALDHPNVVTGRRVVPGAIGAKRLAERTTELGEGTPLYMSRVRGVAPAQSKQALIKMDWLERQSDPDGYARALEAAQGEALALGVDISDQEGGDPAGVSRWLGNVMTEIEEVLVGTSQAVKDAEALGELLLPEIVDPEDPINPRHVGADAIGVGASFVNSLRREGVNVRRLVSSRGMEGGLDVEGMWSETEVTEDGDVVPVGPRVMQVERFLNLRAAMWWRLREDLRMGRVWLTYDEKLFRELTVPRWEPKNGVIVVQPKDEIRDMLGRSPNLADAAVYGNYVRPRLPSQRKRQVLPERTGTRDTGLEELLHRREKERKRAGRTLLQQYRAMKRA